MRKLIKAYLEEKGYTDVEVKIYKCDFLIAVNDPKGCYLQITCKRSVGNVVRTIVCNVDVNTYNMTSNPEAEIENCLKIVNKAVRDDKWELLEKQESEE